MGRRTLTMSIHKLPFIPNKLGKDLDLLLVIKVPVVILFPVPMQGRAPYENRTHSSQRLEAPICPDTPPSRVMC